MEQTLKRVPQASEKGGTLSRIFTTRSFSMLRYILLLAALQAANCFPLSTPVARAPASNSLALTCQLRDVQPEVSRRALLGSALVFGTGFLSAQPAAADMTLNSFKRAYFRYVPRIEQGRDFYVLSLRKLIELGKWDEVKKLYELTSVAQVWHPSHACQKLPLFCAPTIAKTLLLQEESTKKQLGLDVKETELTRQLLLPLEVRITERDLLLQLKQRICASAEAKDRTQFRVRRKQVRATTLQGPECGICWVGFHHVVRREGHQPEAAQDGSSGEMMTFLSTSQP
eukprot:2126698-Rhodomonas_salina.2